MKRKTNWLVVMTLFVALSSQAFSLLKVEGTYNIYPQESGLGLGINFPMIPFVDTTLYITKLGDVNIVLPSFTYESYSFSAGSIKFNTLALEMQAKFGLPMTGVSVGVTGLFDLLTGEDGSGAMVGLPGSMYTGFFGEYKQDLAPLISVFGQAGFLFKILDGEKTINDKITPIVVDLSKVDKSGLFMKAGVRIGF